jgi:hypothetical protein
MRLVGMTEHTNHAGVEVREVEVENVRITLFDDEPPFHQYDRQKRA